MFEAFKNIKKTYIELVNEDIGKKHTEIAVYTKDRLSLIDETFMSISDQQESNECLLRNIREGMSYELHNQFNTYFDYYEDGTFMPLKDNGYLVRAIKANHLNIRENSDTNIEKVRYFIEYQIVCLLFDEKYIPSLDQRIKNVIYEIVESKYESMYDKMMIKNKINKGQIKNFSNLYGIIKQKLDVDKYGQTRNKISKTR